MIRSATTILLFGASGTSAFSVSPPPAAPVEVVVSAPSLFSKASLSPGLPYAQSALLWVSSNTLSSTAVIPATTASPAAAVPAATTSSAPAVSIADIKYDGLVPTTESDEYVVISNRSKSPIDMSGYSVSVFTTGTQGATFVFPKEAVIKPGMSVRVYTNEIHKESGGFSFGYKRAIWNNRGGVAVLMDSNGKKIGEFKYSSDKA